MSETAKLRFTGHALIDVGVAGVCAFTKRKRPEDVTLDDLDQVSDFMVETYYGEKLGTYLTCVFMNASFVQPKEGKEKREAFISQYLRAHRAEPDALVAGQFCAFSGLPATSPLVRTHFPLFSGEGVVNFRPDGESWVPAAGPFVVALMFLPMACRRAEGKLLAVHTEDSALMLAFARRNLERNRVLLEMPLPESRVANHLAPGFESEIPSWDAQKKRYKFADVKGPRSFVIANLGEIAREAAPGDIRPHQVGLTAYLISNSGQGPSCEMFDVPSGVSEFVIKASEATTAKAWQAVTKRFYPVKGQADDDETTTAAPKKKRASGSVPAPDGRPGWSKNPAFEDLCSIYEPGFLDLQAAGRWVSRYVLGRINMDRGPRRYEKNDARLWALAELFLKEVMDMKPERIEAIKKFADKLADWVANKNDKKLYRSLMMQSASELRRSLLRAQQDGAKGGALLFEYDEYARVWLHEDGYGGERLVRDLICIRVVERLYQQKFFDENPDAVIEDLGTEEAKNEEDRQ
jgi:CRISPR-associated protein Cst1